MICCPWGNLSVFLRRLIVIDHRWFDICNVQLVATWTLASPWQSLSSHKHGSSAIWIVSLFRPYAKLMKLGLLPHLERNHHATVKKSNFLPFPDFVPYPSTTVTSSPTWFFYINNRYIFLLDMFFLSFVSCGRLLWHYFHLGQQWWQSNDLMILTALTWTPHPCHQLPKRWIEGSTSSSASEHQRQKLLRPHTNI